MLQNDLGEHLENTRLHFMALCLDDIMFLRQPRKNVTDDRNAKQIMDGLSADFAS